MGIRKAISKDSVQIAPLIFSSGPVTFDYIFSTRHGPAVVDFLKIEFAESQTMFSHRHHHVYERDGNVVGSIGSFDAPSHSATFLGNARAIFCNYGLRGVLKGLLFELRLMKAPRKGCLYLFHVAVREDCRGQGIAAQMINFMMAKGREGGYRCLSLDVAEKNTNALRLYQQLGFEVVNRNKTYNSVLDNHLYMELDLAAANDHS
ncbi:GNAT family N-acetyltransferase [Zhongshania arctica]|uniref:GNAT family N-acetyltransferase n=1 Tax=Zhongshania arctica TaxID=3238302 RepID=A0ABV3TVL8_9GAMM